MEIGPKDPLSSRITTCVILHNQPFTNPQKAFMTACWSKLKCSQVWDQNCGTVDALPEESLPSVKRNQATEIGK